MNTFNNQMQLTTFLSSFLNIQKDNNYLPQSTLMRSLISGFYKALNIWIQLKKCNTIWRFLSNLSRQIKK